VKDYGGGRYNQLTPSFEVMGIGCRGIRDGQTTPPERGAVVHEKFYRGDG